MIDLAVKKDPAKTVGYSLRKSKHDALRRIASVEGHGNATRVLEDIVEKHLRHEYGRDWAAELDLDEGEEGAA
jgi:hypothetical protein